MSGVRQMLQMLQAPKLVQLNKLHQPARPSAKMEGVVVCNAGRISLDGKDLKFLLWNDDPERLRRRCASVARPSSRSSSKRSSVFPSNPPLNP
ncbi:hypothetical protein [Mycolicibacter engbaekii]|nr:hypothetical protein [Mycolicibacter engbaekii]